MAGSPHADKSEVISILGEAYASRISDLNQSIELGERALFLSRSLNDKELIGKSLSQLSLFFMIKGAYDASTAMAEEAISYFKELNDEKGIADAKYNLAGIYYKTDNLHLGLIYLTDCLATYRKFNDYHNQARVQKSLGTIYEFFGDQNNAVKAYEASIEAAIKANDSGLESNAYNPLSGIYIKRGRIDDAMTMIEKAIAMKKQAGDVRGLAFSLYGRAKIFIHTGAFSKAVDDLNNALGIHTEAGERLGTGMAYRKLGLLYMAMKEPEKAKQAFQHALDVADMYNIAMIRFKSNYHLYQIFKQENNTQKSLEYLERYLSQKEAVINTQTMQVIENYELITRMETLEKETQMQKEKTEIIEKKNIAEQASKMKQEFLSTMSHEIRTPLNAVITISSLLKERSDGDDKELLDSLKFSAHNLLRIVNDILDFTKLETGNAKLETHSVNLKTLLEKIRQAYASIAREKGIELKLSATSAVDGFFELDDTKISQILGNLVINAIKYTDSGSVRIIVETLRAGADTDTVRFKIMDTGCGIAEEYFEKIFESFSQPQSITTRKQGGSGLGLAIVKKLVELHGSSIHIESVVGQGTSFYFDVNLKRTAAKDLPGEKRFGRLDKTVLLAEDNMVNAMVAIKLLSKWGVVTEHAKNGVEAIEKSRLRLYDLILMDIHMPEMNGFDASRNIRLQENPNCLTPIFAFTADITADQNEENSQYFNGFLRKPIDVDKLYDTLNEAK